jgi:hypothetical protein
MGRVKRLSAKCFYAIDRCSLRKSVSVATLKACREPKQAVSLSFDYCGRIVNRIDCVFRYHARRSFLANRFRSKRIAQQHNVSAPL